jgi:hypothetical protein
VKLDDNEANELLSCKAITADCNLGGIAPALPNVPEEFKEYADKKAKAQIAYLNETEDLTVEQLTELARFSKSEPKRLIERKIKLLEQEN